MASGRLCRGIIGGEVVANPPTFPAGYRARLHDVEPVPPAVGDAREERPDQAIAISEPQTLDGALVDGQLMVEDSVLKLEVGAGYEGRADDREDDSEHETSRGRMVVRKKRGRLPRPGATSTGAACRGFRKAQGLSRAAHPPSVGASARGDPGGLTDFALEFLTRTRPGN